MNRPTFLDRAELATLTGRVQKAKQIEALRTMGVAFRVNACGRPVVARVEIEGGHAAPKPEAKLWAPAVLQNSRRDAKLC